MIHIPNTWLNVLVVASLTTFSATSKNKTNVPINPTSVQPGQKWGFYFQPIWSEVYFLFPTSCREVGFHNSAQVGQNYFFKFFLETLLKMPFSSATCTWKSWHLLFWTIWSMPYMFMHRTSPADTGYRMWRSAITTSAYFPPHYSMTCKTEKRHDRNHAVSRKQLWNCFIGPPRGAVFSDQKYFSWNS